MNKKIEINILSFFLIESIINLFFFKESFINLLMGLLIGILLIKLIKSNKKNPITQYILVMISLIFIYLIFLNIIHFINYNILRNYSTFIIGLSFIIITLNLVLRGYHSYIKTVETTSYIILFLKTITIILLIPLLLHCKINITIIHNIKPNIIILFALSIFLLNKYLYYLTDYQLSIKVIMISFINYFITKMISLIILGKSLFNIYQYPFINILKQIKYFDFIERIDGLLSFQFILPFFFLLSFLLLFIIIICNRTRIF